MKQYIPVDEFLDKVNETFPQADYTQNVICFGYAQKTDGEALFVPQMLSTGAESLKLKERDAVRIRKGQTEGTELLKVSIQYGVSAVELLTFRKV